MANANPSGLGYVNGRAQPEKNLPAAPGQVIKRYDGTVVRRVVMTNGNVMDTAVFPGDYPDAPHEADLAAAEKKGAKSNG